MNCQAVNIFCQKKNNITCFPSCGFDSDVSLSMGYFSFALGIFVILLMC